MSEERITNILMIMISILMIMFMVNVSFSLCTKAVNDPQAFFEGRVH